MCEEIMYLYNCKIIKVIDGDTVDIEIDCGFNISVKERIRLEGINAPETRTKDKKEKSKGFEAKAYLIHLLSSASDSPITIRTAKDKGKFGRWIGKLYRDDKCINYLMVETGHAEYREY